MGNPILDTAQGVGVVDFTALAISDTHCYAPGSTQGDSCATQLPNLFAACNQHQYDYIIHTGDSLQGGGGGTFAQQATVYNTMKAGLRDRPWLTLLGNHDTIAAFDVEGEVMPLLGMTDRWFYTDIPGTNWRFIHLFSQGVAGDGVDSQWGLGATQTAWLSSLLADSSSAGKYVVIMTHNPIHGIAAPKWAIEFKGENPVTTTTYDLRDDHHWDVLAIFDLLEQYAPMVKACLSGHEHGPDYCIDDNLGGLVWYNLGAVCGQNWANEYWSKARACYNHLTFFNNGTIGFRRFNFWR